MYEEEELYIIKKNQQNTTNWAPRLYVMAIKRDKSNNTRLDSKYDLATNK